MNESLFPELPAEAPPAPLTAGERRRRRQVQLMEAGLHPLSIVGGRIRLHHSAASARDRTAPGLRCGSCARRFHIGGHAKSYPKCEIAPTHSEASDVRAWWPACIHYKPEEVTS